MMATYQLKGGDQIIATTPSEFLHQLHIGSRFDHEGTDFEFMQRFADRLHEFEGYHISTESPELFLADLVSHGFVAVE